MSTSHHRSSLDESTVLIDLDARQACGIAYAILCYLATRTGPPTRLHAELKALALFLQDASRERMEGMLPLPLDECA